MELWTKNHQNHETLIQPPPPPPPKKEGNSGNKKKSKRKYPTKNSIGLEPHGIDGNTRLDSGCK